MSARILLVEDDAIAQIVFVQQLQQCGCWVDLAKTGEEAIEKFITGDHDFILMDIRLSGTSGFEVTRCIRATEKGRAIPIIGITAYPLFYVEEESVAAGINEVVAKPCSNEIVIKLIATYSPEFE